MPRELDVPVGAVPEGWQHARLIPTHGLRSDREREKRATSCLLAVMHGVPEFGYALLRELDAPKASNIETFAEVRFKDSVGKVQIPDGAIICRRGKKTWTCLVEVKTGTNRLRDDQVAGYVDLAKTNGLDGVLTISTQITASSSESPVSIDKRKLRGVMLWHFSWWRVLTEAVVQQRYRGVSDPDQEWILRELIHYLSSESSGAFGFEDMGDKWVAVRKSAHDGTLRAGDTSAREVAERWEQFTHYLALSLAQELGTSVTAVRRPQSQTTPARLDELVKALTNDGKLASTLRIPAAAGPLEIRADLRARQTSVSVTVGAPNEGGAKKRFNWLLRQLKDASDELLIEARFPNARSTTVATLGKVRKDPAPLYYANEPKREPREFSITQAKQMGQKRGRAEGSFVRETGAQTVGFYRDVVQDLKAWQPSAPKLHLDVEAAEESPESEQIVTPTWDAEDSSESALM
jgi:hypothetical protein